MKNSNALEIIQKRKNNIINLYHFKDLIFKIIFLIITIFLMLNFIFGLKIMANNDMSPMIGPSDLLLYYRLDKDFLPEDVVVIEKEGKEYVLRIVAKSGDDVNITENGLVINGAVQHNSRIFYPTGYYEEGIELPVKLQNDEFFVLGDLREGAVDSRYFGKVSKSEIKGKVFSLFRRTKF